MAVALSVAVATTFGPWRCAREVKGTIGRGWNKGLALFTDHAPG